jgi:Ca2+-binding EF-hand superfamily protein
MDTNGNGSIDPEEAQGPARFMLDRMARNNPKIDLSKPIPISVITEAFQQMRNGGSPGGGPGGDMNDESVDAGPSTLVPTFGIKIDKAPPPGFGASGAKSAIKVEDRDLREAEDRVRRYDKNSDGMLDETELKEARWSEPPLQWDRNKDGKLSKQEVAARYARRREQRDTQDPNRQRGNEEARKGDKTANTEDSKTKAHPFEKQASFRIGDSASGAAKPAGVPEWFTREDIDNDNQVSMKEFARKWDEATLEGFNKFDTNGDGYITVKEVLAGVKKGYLKGSSSGSSSGSSDGSTSTASTAPAGGTPSGNTGGSSGKADDSMREFARTRIEKADKDKNGFLTPDEFKERSAKFSDVDTDGNGQISLDEYAAFRNKRYERSDSQ